MMAPVTLTTEGNTIKHRRMEGTAPRQPHTHERQHGGRRARHHQGETFIMGSLTGPCHPCVLQGLR